MDPTLLFSLVVPFICLLYEWIATRGLSPPEGSPPTTHQRWMNAHTVNVVMLLDVAFILDMWIKGRTLLATLGAVLYIGFHILPRSVLAVIAINGLYSSHPWLSWDGVLTPTRQAVPQETSSIRSLIAYSFRIPLRRKASLKSTSTFPVEPRRHHHTLRKSEVAISYVSINFTILRTVLRLRVIGSALFSFPRIWRCWPRGRCVADTANRSVMDGATVEMPSCDSPDSTLLWPPPPSRTVTTGPSARSQRRWASAVIESLSPGWRSARNFVYSRLSHRSGQSPTGDGETVQRSHTELEMVGPDLPAQTAPQTSTPPDADSQLISTAHTREHPPRRSLGMTPDAYQVLLPITDGLDNPDYPASSPSPTNSAVSPTRSDPPTAAPRQVRRDANWRRAISQQKDSDILDSLDFVTTSVAVPACNAALLGCFALITEAYHILDGIRWTVATDLEEQLEFLFSMLVLLYMHVTALGINLLRFHCLIVPVVVEGVSTASFSVTTLIALLLSVVNCLTLFSSAAYDEQIVNAIIDAI